MVAPDKSALYVYDANNRLIKATVQDGTNVIAEEYTYDFTGNRTSKTTTTDGGFDFIKYVLDTNSSLTQVLAELNADKTEKAYYTRGTDLISQERDGKTSYYLYDGHGSVRMLADESGNVTDTYDYDAFGNLTNSTGNTANNYRYCGEQFDGTTGLYYLRARYMNPHTGTFISMDSYSGSINDPVSLHKYLYANANPVMYSDPSGYMSLGEVATVGAVIGALSSGLITVGMNILKNYDETGELKCDVTFGEVAVSMIIGGAFGALGAVALYCKIVWLTYLLASIAFSNGVGTAVIGYFEYENGNYGSAMGYSILSILSFIGAGKLFSKANSFNNGTGRSKNLVYGSSAKSSTKLTNQMNKRGWTIQSINDTVEYPYTTRQSTNLATGNSATVFYKKDGSYIIVDDTTNEIVQISNCNDPNWVPDPNIQDPYDPNNTK